MSLFDDVEMNKDNNYQFIILNIFAFNDQDLERMINEANVFVDNVSCENVFDQILLVSSSSDEDHNSTDSNIILTESDTVFAESDIVLAESNTVFAEFDTISAKSNIVLADSNIILIEEVSETIFEKILETNSEEVSIEEDFFYEFSNADSSSIISQKKQFEIELLNNFALLISTFFSTNVLTCSSTNIEVARTTRKTSIVKIARKTSITNTTKRNKKSHNKITKLLRFHKFKFQIKRMYNNFLQL
jgi:hypothetical protein